MPIVARRDERLNRCRAAALVELLARILRSRLSQN
jgi:hypothetical protein